MVTAIVNVTQARAYALIDRYEITAVNDHTPADTQPKPINSQMNSQMV